MDVDFYEETTIVALCWLRKDYLMQALWPVFFFPSKIIPSEQNKKKERILNSEPIEPVY